MACLSHYSNSVWGECREGGKKFGGFREGDLGKVRGVVEGGGGEGVDGVGGVWLGFPENTLESLSNDALLLGIAKRSL